MGACKKILLFVNVLMVSLAMSGSLASYSLLQAETVASKPYMIAGKPVVLALPKNYCVLDATHPSDKTLIDSVEKSVKGFNELLVQFADCQELKEWRSGKQKYLNNLGNYQTSLKFKKTDMTGREAATIKEICTLFKKQSETLMDDIKPEIDRRVKEGFKDVEINKMKMIGVVHEDPSVCVTAAFQRLKTENGSVKDQVNISGVSVLNGRLIFSYLYTPSGDEQVVVEKSKAMMLDLNQDNQLKNNQQQ